MLGASIASKEVINVIIPIVLVPNMLFAGFFVNQDSIAWYLKPLGFVSVYKYSFNAYFLNEYDGLKLDCMTSLDVREFCDPMSDFNPP